MVAPGWSGAGEDPDDEAFRHAARRSSAAAQHPDHLAYPPERLPAGARQKVAQALLKNDLVIAVHGPAHDAHAKWTVEGEEMLLRLTDAGLRAIGIEPKGDARRRTSRAPPPSPAATPRASPPRRPPHGARGAHGRGGHRAAGRGRPGAGARTGRALGAGRRRDQEEEDDRPRHERLGVDDALIYGPAEEWQQPAGDAALLEQALAERTPRGLKAAAAAILATWDDEANREGDMIGALGRRRRRRRPSRAAMMSVSRLASSSHAASTALRGGHQPCAASAPPGLLRAGQRLPRAAATPSAGP